MGKFLDITGVSTFWKKVKTKINTEIQNQILNKIGNPEGIAPLDSTGQVPWDCMPTFKTINGESIKSELGNTDIKIDLSLYKIVTELPISDQDVNKIYLVIDTEGNEEKNNVYKEYIYTSVGWELLGQYKANIDLTPYVKKTDVVTTSVAGLMPSSDKIKLNSIATDATKDEAISSDELNSILV